MSRDDAVKILYEGHPPKATYQTDFTYHNYSYLIELKTIKSTTKPAWAQIIHNLRATHIPNDHLSNFG